MSEKLKDFQVLDVFCGGTFYKVRHKVTNNIFAWKAYDCSAFSDEQIQNVVNEVKIISQVLSANLIRYYDTILHSPSKTLYFVLEYNSWRNVQELIEECKATDKHIEESFIWRLLHELARVYKSVEEVNTVVLQKCLTPESVFVSENGELRINCFNLTATGSTSDVMRQVGDLIHTICYTPNACDKIKEFHYSDDLRDVISLLIEDRDSILRPDVVLYHPTVLANLGTLPNPTQMGQILVSKEFPQVSSEVNKCDSEKAIELGRAVEPLPRTVFNVTDSPIYSNINIKHNFGSEIQETHIDRNSLSPNLAALALELPGYVPRSRKPFTSAITAYNCPQKISEETLSQQWMSRLMALREREESLNKREKDIIAKEIINSPSTQIIPLNNSNELLFEDNSNGITLPPLITHFKDNSRDIGPRQRRRRASSVRSRGRRKSYGYEDLDSSLSADTGDNSMIVTSTKFTKDNMPRRNIFPDVSNKHVHFTSNPFVESDESVTLTYYELENADKSYGNSKVTTDITKFKYLDPIKLSTEKRASKNCSHSSPSKQAKVTKNMLSNNMHVTNSIKKTPSKTSLSSMCSTSSRFSTIHNQWSVDSMSVSCVSDKYRNSNQYPQTPTAQPDLKKSKTRKSLLNFKTPFKFRTTTKI